MIGALAHKFYMIFQHHLPPSKSHHDGQEESTTIPLPELQYVLGSKLGVGLCYRGSYPST